MFTILALWGMTAGGYVRSALRNIADDRGQDMVEYALVIGVVAIGIVALFLLVPFGEGFEALAFRVGCLIGGAGTVIDGTTCT